MKAATTNNCNSNKNDNSINGYKTNKINVANNIIMTAVSQTTK